MHGYWSCEKPLHNLPKPPLNIWPFIESTSSSSESRTVKKTTFVRKTYFSIDYLIPPMIHWLFFCLLNAFICCPPSETVFLIDNTSHSLTFLSGSAANVSWWCYWLRATWKPLHAKNNLKSMSKVFSSYYHLDRPSRLLPSVVGPCK